MTVPGILLYLPCAHTNDASGVRLMVRNQRTATINGMNLMDQVGSEFGISEEFTLVTH